MKILIYGAGVIGCTYGWQLSKAGHEVSVLVRKGKKQLLDENGISIHCTDFRNGKKSIEQIVFRPRVIEELLPQNDYEYIIVSTRSIQLKEVLSVLATSAGKAHILFFQNIWNDFDEIARHLSTNQYFFGFPFMVGGGRDAQGLNSIISDSKYSKTMLGEVDGKISPRIQKIAIVMESANMKPFISEQITTWLIPHSVFIAGLSAGVIKAGCTMKAFTCNPKIVKEAIMAIREGFNICSMKGINPKKEKVNKLYYLPLFISTPIVRYIFSDETMCMMFDGYLRFSTDEVRHMLRDIIKDGEKLNIEMPNLKSLEKNIIN